MNLENIVPVITNQRFIILFNYIHKSCNLFIFNCLSKYKNIHIPYFYQEYVWNFGALSSKDEAEYIAEIVKKSLNIKLLESERSSRESFIEKQKLFIDLLSISQEFLRDNNFNEV